MRLGVGVGWQAAEYEALGEDFATRGRRMDETIGYLRACWGDERIQQRGARFLADEIAMEPKPPQGERLPIWVGGLGPVALKRAGELGDGWMGMAAGSDEDMRGAIATIRGHAAEAGRDPAAVGLQAMLAPPPNDAGGKTFYQDHGRVVARAEQLAGLGFEWIALNATAIFQSGARRVADIADQLEQLHTALRAAVA